VLPGVIAIVVALAAAAVAGVLTGRGRFRGPRRRMGRGTADGPTAGALSAAELGAPLGDRATLVQFSTAFCAPCRGTRQVLARVAETSDGVSHVEIDATTRLDLVRRFNITSTPTTLVLSPTGVVTRRATGMPRMADVAGAVGTVTAGRAR
jgi:thiol-disulfide isomerase/thioredoxin